MKIINPTGRLQFNKTTKKTPTTEALEAALKEPYKLLKYKIVLTEDSKKMYISLYVLRIMP